jgi:hypothetical protein
VYTLLYTRTADLYIYKSAHIYAAVSKFSKYGSVLLNLNLLEFNFASKTQDMIVVLKIENYFYSRFIIFVKAIYLNSKREFEVYIMISIYTVAE